MQQCIHNLVLLKKKQEKKQERKQKQSYAWTSELS